MIEGVDRTVPVIAVFGSKEANTQAPAEAVGRQVGRQHCILLTGGGRGKGRPAVKESAMDGAERARKRNYVAARVGVLGSDEDVVGHEVSPDDTKLILAPAYGDRRNYLNACMCDVAIAFHGGPGTKSEVAFSLALGRPVIVVGEAWDAEYPVSHDRAAYGAFLKASTARVPGDGGEDIDSLITDAYASLDAEKERAVEQLPLDHPAKAIVQLARKKASGTGLPGEFPELPDRRDLASTYAAWVTRMDERLRDQDEG